MREVYSSSIAWHKLLKGHSFVVRAEHIKSWGQHLGKVKHMLLGSFVFVHTTIKRIISLQTKIVGHRM